MSRRPSFARHLHLLLIVALLGAAAWTVLPAQAQDPPANGDTAAATQTTLDERRAGIEQDLLDLRVRIEALPADAPPERKASLEAELSQLERIDLVLSQQASAVDRVSELRESLSQLTATLEDLRAHGPDETPPYSLLLLDATREELETLEARTEAVDVAVTAASAAAADARRVAQEKESARRRATEVSESNTDDTKRVELAAAARIAQIESRLANEMLALRQIELERESLGQEIHTTRIDTLTTRLDWISGSVVLTRSDLEAKLFELETARSQLADRLRLLEGNTDYLENRWFDAKRRLDATPTPDPVLVEEVTARRLALQATRESIESINKRREYLDGAELVWGRRFDLARETATAESLIEWETESRDRINALNIEQRVLTSRMTELRDELGAVTTRRNAIDGSAPETRWLREQQDHLRTMSETADERLRAIESAIRLHHRLLDEIGVEAANVTIGERLRVLWKSISSIWQIGVWSVENAEITVGKIVIGTTILFFGLFASRSLSRLLGRRILPRLKLDEGGAAAIQSILFYILLVTFTLFAFRAVNIPLTAFTVLGGALAIGVGFGSQNIIANFISGLILLAERPIRVGDLVQVDDLYGTVEQIGARSARVRTGNNVDIVVPNSRFLEQNVVNWTLAEDRIRTHVAVGVAYGSPTRDVTKLLMRAAEEHGRVHKKPHPIVLFRDFGDNALHFEIHFWITMKRVMDRQVIESDVRFRIDSLFREAGIVIAFPQRDVHLTSLTPVDIRILERRAPDNGEISADDPVTLDRS